MTARQLSEIYVDIPSATLYRSLKKMTADEIPQVVEENRIRGTVEKVYSITGKWQVDAEKMVEDNNGPMYLLLFTRFIMGLSEEFAEYAAREGIDLLRDGSGFTVAPVWATTEELTAAITGIGEILGPLVENKKTPERSLHSIAIITTPPKGEIKQGGTIHAEN